MSGLVKFIEKYRRELVIIVTIILFIGSLINFYFQFEVSPRSNDECVWDPQKVGKDSVAFVFEQVKVGGVTWEAGIRNGDYLIAINGERIHGLIQASIIFDKFEEGEYADYTVSRNGEMFETKVRVKKLINYYILGISLLAFFWLIVGFIVVMAKPQGLVQVLFFRIGASFTLIALSHLISFQTPPNPIFEYPWLVKLIAALLIFGASFLPFLIVHFFLVFPITYKFAEKRITRIIIYATPTIIYFISLYSTLVYFRPKEFTTFINLPVVGILNLFYIAGIFAGLILLTISFFRLKNKKERKPVGIILFSFILGIASFIYAVTLANVLADNIFNSPEYYMPVILMSVIPIAFAYSIFKYSLMDISDVVKNTILYGIATIAIAGIYFFIIYFIGQQVGGVVGTQYQGIIAGVVFVIFALVFQSTKDRFQQIVTAKFYPEQFAYQKVLIKFSKDVTIIVGLNNILDSIQQTFIEYLKLDTFGIMLKCEETNDYQLKRSAGISSEDLTVSLNEDQIKKIIETKEERNIPSFIERGEFKDACPSSYQKLIEEGIYTIIPMMIKQRVTGLLLFGLKYSGAQFSGKDLELLNAFANQAAISIENARLYESEAEKLKITRDLENAKHIQESLLPKEIPNVEGMDICGKMISAMQVGGDYFDVIKVSESKVFVVVGDVSGKGLSASFYMTKLQTMMRLYCTADKSPKEVLIEINRQIYNSIERNWFITVSIALFDTEKKIVKFCRAGHAPLLIGHNGSASFCQSQGIGLGLEYGKIFDSTLEEEEIDLKEEKTFVFFSDGLSEAMNEEKELFGLERLKTILVSNKTKNSSEVLKDILQQLKSFKKSEPTNDDITLVIAKNFSNKE